MKTNLAIIGILIFIFLCWFGALIISPLFIAWDMFRGRYSSFREFKMEALDFLLLPRNFPRGYRELKMMARKKKLEAFE